MARPRTKTDPIAIRLPLAAGVELERRAAAKGLSVRQFLESSLAAALSRPMSGDPVVVRLSTAAAEELKASLNAAGGEVEARFPK